MKNRPPITHLLAIALALAALAAGAWFYTSASEPVEGIPEPTPAQEGVLDDGTVSVFYPSKTPDGDPCTTVVPVSVKLEGVAPEDRPMEALKILLKGVPAGYEATVATSLPQGVQLKSLGVKDGVATADFNAALNRVAGSCRVTSIRLQIESTLKQFRGIEQVIIAVEGDVDEALQP